VERCSWPEGYIAGEEIPIGKSYENDFTASFKG
jgi:hypothetical protein